MTNDGLQSIKVSKETYDALVALKREVRERGLGILPTELRDSTLDDEARAVSLNELVGIGVRATRAAMKRGGR